MNHLYKDFTKGLFFFVVIAAIVGVSAYNVIIECVGY